MVKVGVRGRQGPVDVTHHSPRATPCCRLGPLTPHAVRTLRHLKDFFGTVFDMRAEKESRTIFLTCLGMGMKNIARKVT